MEAVGSLMLLMTELIRKSGHRFNLRFAIVFLLGNTIAFVFRELLVYDRSGVAGRSFGANGAFAIGLFLETDGAGFVAI
jgi:hypothetical protein